MGNWMSKLSVWLNIAPAHINPPQEYLASDNYALFGQSQSWAPQGYVDGTDEIVQNRYMASGPFSWATQYAWSAPFSPQYGRSGQALVGDTQALQSYEWGYIPTEQQLASAVALQNIGNLVNHGVEIDKQQIDPMQNQLIQAIYRSANSFWQDVRISNGTGWGYPNG